MIIDSGGRLAGTTTTEGPWTSEMFTTVSQPRRRLICEHLARGPVVRPLFIVAPYALGCARCLDIAMAAQQARPEACDNCRAPGPTSVLIAQRELFIAVGELCNTCLGGEIGSLDAP
jgi:hypothetical protein